MASWKVRGVCVHVLSYTSTDAHNLGFKEDTREDMPAWDGLLYIYAVLFVPVFFVLLVGVNLQVWAASRINYVFIFGGFCKHYRIPYYVLIPYVFRT